MTTCLLDANVLIALTIGEHEHHIRAARWLAEVDSFAVCPVVEGALVRFLLRMGESGATAAAILGALRKDPRCLFWTDDLSYADVELRDLRGHRQVTDAYLAGLALKRGVQLATFDEGLTTLRPEAAFLIPR